jgi:hypothetical protein
MRILIIDPMAASLDWIMRLQEEGHKIKWAVKPDDKVAKVGKGIVERVPDLSDFMNWPDMVFYADNTYYTHYAEAFRKRGVPVIGPNLETSRVGTGPRCGHEGAETGRGGLPANQGVYRL